jgi:diguanylate cyclase (GGDEF)-like protein/PAS domain S-box-containing protein
MLGYEASALIGIRASVLVDPDDLPAVMDRLALPADQFDRAEPMALRLRRADGRWRVMEASARHCLDVPSIRGIVVTLRDLTEHRAQTEALRQQRDLFDAVIDHAGALVIVTDGSGVIQRYNRACEELTGVPASRVLGQHFWDVLVAPDEVDRIREIFLSNRPSPPSQQLQLAVRWVTAAGSERMIDWVSTVVVDERGSVSFVVSTGRDVTRQRETEEELAHRALHDPLTGLPNRTLLLDRLSTALRRAMRNAGRVVVLFCDLDGFKRVNDTFGHSVGDTVLVEVSARLEAACRAEDTVARIGGDEFVVLVEGLEGVEGAEKLVDRIRVTLSDPIEVDGKRAELSVSVGVAATPPASAQSATDLLILADRAMYADKRARARGRL